MKALLALARFDIRAFSPALLSGMYAIDLIASRHFRTPVAPSFWYQMMPSEEVSGDQVGTDVPSV
jgi:hypothetical protein